MQVRLTDPSSLQAPYNGHVLYPDHSLLCSKGLTAGKIPIGKLEVQVGKEWIPLYVAWKDKKVGFVLIETSKLNPKDSNADASDKKEHPSTNAVLGSTSVSSLPQQRLDREEGRQADGSPCGNVDEASEEGNPQEEREIGYH